MIKKIILVLLLLSVTVVSYSAENTVDTIDIDASGLKGKVKAGISLGYPTGITAGYRVSNIFEMNGTIGTDFDGITLGGSGLFNIVKFRFEGEIFPLSIGPAIYIHDHDHSDHHNKHHHTHLDVLCTARLEYDFKEIPLNLFVEAGLGLRVIEFADTAGSLAIGVRYIF